MLGLKRKVLSGGRAIHAHAASQRIIVWRMIDVVLTKGVISAAAKSMPDERHSDISSGQNDPISGFSQFLLAPIPPFRRDLCVVATSVSYRTACFLFRKLFRSV